LMRSVSWKREPRGPNDERKAMHASKAPIRERIKQLQEQQGKVELALPVKFEVAPPAPDNPPPEEPASAPAATLPISPFPAGYPCVFRATTCAMRTADNFNVSALSPT
jgi:hypothetical protein